MVVHEVHLEKLCLVYLESNYRVVEWGRYIGMWIKALTMIGSGVIVESEITLRSDHRQHRVGCWYL